MYTWKTFTLWANRKEEGGAEGAVRSSGLNLGGRAVNGSLGAFADCAPARAVGR